MTREGYNYWDKMCAITRHAFLFSPCGERIVAEPGMGTWVDRHAALEVVYQAQGEINDLRAEVEQQYAMKIKAREQRDAITIRYKDLKAEMETMKSVLDAAKYDKSEREPVSHDWDDQDKCRLCGDRDWYASATCTPKQQPSPDVSALVEVLEGLLGVIGESRGVSGYHLNWEIAGWDEFQEVHDAIAALATYRKGGDL